MQFMIDTNIAIHIRDGDQPVLQKAVAHRGHVVMSSLTLAELRGGIYKSPALSNLRRLRLEPILQQIPVLAFDDAAANTFGDVIAACGWTRDRDFDRMIAAHAISANLTLVTNNVADFADIPGLVLENWAV
jgi:tRNA(fMet)-specific endonuclease VapC